MIILVISNPCYRLEWIGIRQWPVKSLGRILPGFTEGCIEILNCSGTYPPVLISRKQVTKFSPSQFSIGYSSWVNDTAAIVGIEQKIDQRRCIGQLIRFICHSQSTMHARFERSC